MLLNRLVAVDGLGWFADVLADGATDVSDLSAKPAGEAG